MINYHKGCLFEYIDSIGGDIFIPHVVNNINQMGSGFVVPLYTRWPKVKAEYHEYCNWCRNTLNLSKKEMLGRIQAVSVSNNLNGISVINMFGQDGVVSKTNPKPIKYDALNECMEKVASKLGFMKELVPEYDVNIVAPKFGAGLAGGDWNIIEEMINKHWSNFNVTICYKI